MNSPPDPQNPLKQVDALNPLQRVSTYHGGPSGAVSTDGLIKTNADLIAAIEQECKTLLANMAATSWDVATVDGVVAAWALDMNSQPDTQNPLKRVDASNPLQRVYTYQPPISIGGASTPALADLTTILHYACTFLVPKLYEGAQAEIDNLRHALNGGYIPPGPSGAPTRGMAHVLPTGRNFYSVDPRALPTVASWQVGQGLADDLLKRYDREEGGYPESVGISMWGTSAMRTAGDDIAQVLALLGVRPIWQPENRRVTGIALIPLEELGRPRIDVVCRISGFFRDAFPHLITLIDSAVQAVIDADEPLDQNFPRKHALTNEAALRLAGHNGDVNVHRPSLNSREQEEQEAYPSRILGLDEQTIKERARYRIFGCKPGSYGAGILPLIDAKNWQSDADFARAYLTWGGYAYGNNAQGLPAQAEFASALKSVQIATKNQDNREHDIFDSDDYLQYHGGMIATVRALTGKNPRRYFGDSSDPSRVKTRDLREEARRVFRSRVVNPKWLASMRRHGYKGALEVAATVDYLFGYDATADILEDWMYAKVAEEFLRNEEMQQFFADSNPWAWQAIAERLLEAIDRGLWQDPDSLDLELLRTAKEMGLADLRRR